MVNLPDLLDDLDAVIWEADPETLDFRYVNRRAVELLGYDRAEWLEPGFWSTRLIHPDDRAATVGACSAAVRQRADHRLEYRALAADGRVLWVRDLIRVVVDGASRVAAVRGVMLDVSAEKSIEAHYRRLVATSPDAVFVLDAQGRVAEVNDAVQRLVGYTPEEMLGTAFDVFIEPEGIAQSRDLVARLMSGEIERAEVEVPLRHRSGEVRVVLASARAIVVEGACIGIHGVARDVTEERATRAQQRLLVAAFDDLPDAVSITDRQIRVLYTNRAHAELLGYDRAHPPEDVLGLLPDDESRDQLFEVYDALEHERRWSGRMRRRRADGSVILVSANIFAVSDGEFDYAITVMRDASSEIGREQHLRRVERLASLGTLIGGVAHELNNPLTAVVGFAHLMLLDERPDEDRETLRTMAREAERAARIVADLRVVARNTQEEAAGDVGPVDVNDVLRHVLRVRRYSLETRNIEVREELADRLEPVLGNRAQLEQVVVNVVVNAEQALDRLDQGPRLLTVRTRQRPDHVVLAFADNGPGIRKDHLERIFDPFFTTKPPGEGTGLGLSLVHSIVTEHGGTMRVESSPGRGAQFVVELPVADRAALEREAAPAPVLPEPGRPLHVLIVDDEASVRDLLTNLLRRRGHSVIEAREGGEALRVIEDDVVRVDVVVSDIRMPGLDGRQLLELLREQRPDLARRLVFITGDAAPAPFSMAELGVEVPVLLKPFHLEQAIGLIEQRAE
ncbi:MAG TPA: PAS domain S-box protein [Longimicrobiales bacterium]